MGWVDGPMMAFDIESTGVSVETDHILTASLVHIQRDYAGYGVKSETVVVNPGVPIPASSTAVHGLTDEFIQANGGDPAEELEAVCMVLAAVLAEQTAPLVGMNLVYDLTILDRNCRRLGLVPLSDRVAIEPAIDVMILDKRVEPFRKGTGMRKLSNVAPLYHVPVEGAHQSAADALMAARVAWRIGRLYPPIGELEPHEIHWLQAQWKQQQDANLAKWLKGKGRDTTGVDGVWPVRLPAETPI